MNLEVTLVKVKAIQDTSIADFLSRARFVDVEDDSKAMSYLTKFLKDNLDTISIAVSDKVFINKLRNKDTFTLTEFLCTKFLLALAGIDIWYYQVSDNEENGFDLPNGMVEYILQDTTSFSKSFVPFATKMTRSIDDARSWTIYDTIKGDYDFFEGDLFNGIDNPMSRMIQLAKDSEEIVHKSAELGTTEYLYQMVKYLGKDIKVLTNK
jgi:hypothetical protein|nr:MAG TPA: hypothetical protein [Bacteriophage sp.]